MHRVPRRPGDERRVRGHDAAFGNPTKPIGPVYTDAEAQGLAAEKDWTFKPDGDHMRRVVPSPAPRGIFRSEPITWLLDRGAIVTCAGGGGIPVMYTDSTVPAGREIVGVEAVIDKDHASALLALELNADALLIVTDVDAVYDGWGTASQHAIRRATPSQLAGAGFAEGSTGPKVRAACAFVENTGKIAAIGSVDDAVALLDGHAGTTVTAESVDAGQEQTR